MNVLRRLHRLSGPLPALVLGLAASLSLAYFADESPLRVLQVLLESSFGTGYDFALTLFYTTPLIFTGLSVAVAAHAGLFNIGAEGQLTVAAMAATCVGLLLPDLPFPIAPLLALMAAVLAGGAWAFVPGWLRVQRGSHEVITTIMFNFLAAALTSWMTLQIFPNPESQNPETRAIGAGYLIAPLDPIHALSPDSPLSSTILLAVAAAVGLWFFLFKTAPGFELRAAGISAEAAEASGLNVKRTRILGMCLAGALAGLVAVAEVLGNSGRFRMGFSPDFGFLGIAVSLLARNSPIGILASALLFGILHKGAGALDLETETVTREFSLILQGMVILFVSSRRLTKND